MATALTLITDAYLYTGLLGVGEALTAERGQFALRQLNNMLDSWAADSLYCKEVVDTSGTVGPGMTFTVGPTGSVVVPVAPVALDEGCFFRLNNIDYPVQLIERETYMNKAFKFVATTRPFGIFYNPGTVNGTCYVYPSLTMAMEVHLQIMQPLTAFADLTTNYNLPVGYQQPIIMSLAEILLIGKRAVDPQLAKAASIGRKIIRNANAAPAMISGSIDQGGNIYTGFMHT